MSLPTAETFILTCPCGHPHNVQTRHAGETRKCVCGRQLDVPTLREILRLPTSLDSTAKPGPPPWTLRQGMLFVLGLPLALVAATAGGYAAWQQSQLDTARPVLADFNLGSFDQLTPTQAWSAWTRVRDQQLDQRRRPDYLLMRERARQLSRRALICAALSGVGIALVLAAILLRPR